MRLKTMLVTANIVNSTQPSHNLLLHMSTEEPGLTIL